MVSPISVLQAVENFRLAKDDRGLYLDQDGESWWTEDERENTLVEKSPRVGFGNLDE